MKLDKKNIGKKQVNKLWSLKCQETEVQMYWTDGFQTRLQSAWKHRKRRQTGTDDQKLRESKERCETQEHHPQSMDINILCVVVGRIC